jgi:HD-GYP domain-containing protein (c-di-GMP phosphodiesterase class II)
MRAAAHYLLATILLTIYGGQVCPFIESLPLWTLFATIGGWLLLFVTCRYLLGQPLVNRIDPLRRPMAQFVLEMFTCGAAGLAMAFYNLIVYDFPLGSGLKLFAGCLTLGFFIASDLALERDYLVAKELARQGTGSVNTLLGHRFVSLTRKMVLVAMALATSMALVLTLVILHDLRWVRMLDVDANLVSASKSILVEFIFVLGVLLALTYNLILSFTRNLKLYFSWQTEALLQVADGRLDGFVPVTTSDEFGVIARYTNEMIDGLRQRTEELQLTRDATIHSLASLAETRDNETGQHIIRTQHYVRILAEELKEHPDFRSFLDATTIDLLYKSAPLHDIGKVGIPDRILLKPGRLTEDEFEIMKQHAVYGRDALLSAVEQLGENSFLHLAREIAHTHHEKWDGSGYPQGLQGTDIPISGRLMALADVYDALISKRIYKEAFSHEKAFDIITEGRGSHFDPNVVDAFLNCEELFKEIAAEHSDKK